MQSEPAPPSAAERRALEREQKAAAEREIAHYGFFDYVVVNDDVEQAYGRLRAIAMAERCRRQRHALRCEQLLAQSTESKS